MQETYWPNPQSDYDSRRRAYLDYCIQAPDQEERRMYARWGFFAQIARLELDQGPLDEQAFQLALDYVDSRIDCCDFSLGGFLRILYKYADSPLLSPELKVAIEQRVLDFKYWWDDLNGDNRRCYWTENHQIIFHSDELLAAQLFPDAVLSNDGQDAAYHRDHALRLIRRWFDYRATLGFSEWLSNCYFEEDLLALVNLYDFAEDDDIRQQAKNCIDIIMFEMAMHSYRGVMGCSHGRTYPRLILGGRHEDASNTAKLMFGMGLYNNPANIGTVCLATSDYPCPAVFEQIAADLAGPRLFKERHSLNVEDAPDFGLDFETLADANLFWSVQDYTHERIYDLAQRTRAAYGVMLYEQAYGERYEQVRQWQIDQYGAVIDPNIDCHGMTEVHIQTYRTAHYLLSCAQDYRAGKPGYQQHPWQATLGIDAVCFTNHPGSDDLEARPNFWAGNGILPRAAQHENVLVCIHHLPPGDAFPFSHAYLPQAAFDEIVEREGWVFARKDDGYLALYSQTPLRWLPDESGAVVEARAEALDNIWLVEMGDSSQWAEFATFVETVASASVQCEGMALRYESPSQGTVEFDWTGPLRIQGREITLHDYPRFDNPYCQTDFGSTRHEIRYSGEQHVIDFGRPGSY